MATQITYGKVKNTRHSAKHCKGVVRKSRSAIIAGNVHICTSVSREEILKRESALLLRPIEYDFILSDDVVVKYEVKPAKPVVKEHDRDFKEMFKPFKPLKAPTVGCSARGGNNSGTKDKSVSGKLSASPDVDNVSTMTGIVPLSRDGHHKTKVGVAAYNKERVRIWEELNQKRRWAGKEPLPAPTLLVDPASQVSAYDAWKKSDKTKPMPKVRGDYPAWATA